MCRTWHRRQPPPPLVPRAAAVQVDRTAAALGLSLVTSSDTCVGPLLPPFGSTLDEDGQEGDGMAAVAAPGKVRTEECCCTHQFVGCGRCPCGRTLSDGSPPLVSALYLLVQLTSFLYG